jgi:RRXRR protein
LARGLDKLRKELTLQKKDYIKLHKRDYRMAVLVIDKNGKPLMPCSEKRARPLLERGRARVTRRTSFQIQLLDRTQEDCVLQPLLIKIDPGRETGRFNLTTGRNVIQGIGYKNCRLLQRTDGYAYHLNTNKFLLDLKVQISA